MNQLNLFESETGSPSNLAQVQSQLETFFENWPALQAHVSSHFMGSRVDTPTKADLVEVGYALTEEIHETLNELKWKPWKNGEPDMHAAIGEFADIMAFLGLLLHYMQVMGASPEELAEATIQKARTNIQRANGEVDNYGRYQ